MLLYMENLWVFTLAMNFGCGSPTTRTSPTLDENSSNNTPLAYAQEVQY